MKKENNSFSAVQWKHKYQTNVKRQTKHKNAMLDKMATQHLLLRFQSKIWHLKKMLGSSFVLWMQPLWTSNVFRNTFSIKLSLFWVIMQNKPQMSFSPILIGYKKNTKASALLWRHWIDTVMLFLTTSQNTIYSCLSLAIFIYLDVFVFIL